MSIERGLQMRSMIRYACLLFTITVLAGITHAGEILDAVRARDSVRCGVSTGLAGFAIADSTGNWTGLDADFCRGLAAAVLGDPTKVAYVPVSNQQRFTALQSGEVDLLSRNTTWTLTRDASLGLMFAGVTFYDGQGFMVPGDLGVQSATELDGAEVCVLAGTTTELNLADYFRASGMSFKPVVFESLEEAKTAFFNGRCQVYTTDRSGLAAIISSDAPNPDDYLILPETISKEPLGPVVRRGDDAWFTIVKWLVYALIEAEEKGVTQGNVASMMGSQNPVVQRLLGVSGDMGTKLGLDNAWAVQAIQAVGNYGEIYRRNVVPIGLARTGSNRLWTHGGLMYAMPLR
jgi:general L-amino acid transport system substrate-binding protein